MEGAVGFIRPVKDAAAVSAAGEGAGKDTVCKYCGEDFKFYRSLKHHLRSQSSCSHKPFTCRSCGVGFSTRPNCLRHIQKQHAAVAGVSIESCMAVNETLLTAQLNAAAGLETSEHPPNKVQKLGLKSLINGSQNIKQEQMQISCDEQPLDFSLKTMNSHSGSPYSVLPVSAGDDADEPLDLSVGASQSGHKLETSEFSSSSPISLVVTSRRTSPPLHHSAANTTPASAGMLQHKWTVAAPDQLQCTHCRAVFKHNSKVQRRNLCLPFILSFCYLLLFHCINELFGFSEFLL